MTGRQIVMNDGTILAGGEIGFSDGKIWCFLKETDFASVYPLFSNPQKTVTLTFVYDEMQDTYVGYTEMSAILKTYDGINVLMSKPQEEINA